MNFIDFSDDNEGGRQRGGPANAFHGPDAAKGIVMARHGGLLLFTIAWLALARFWGLLFSSAVPEGIVSQQMADVSAIARASADVGRPSRLSAVASGVSGNSPEQTAQRPFGQTHQANGRMRGVNFLTVSRGESSRPMWRSAADTRTASTRTVRLPPHSLLVVLSLDLTGAAHEFRVQSQVAADSTGEIATAETKYCELVRGIGEPLSPLVTGNAAALVAEGAADECADPLARGGIWPTHPDHSRPVPSELFFADDGRGTGQIVRTFRMPRFSGSQVGEETSRAFECLRTRRVSVFLETDKSGTAVVAPEQKAHAIRIAELCELGLLNAVEREAGAISDVDGDGRLTIVLTPLEQERTTGQIPVRGCVREADFLDPWTGLGGDIVYLDRDGSQKLSGRELAGLLAHEFTHAAMYSRLLERRQAGLSELGVPGWFHEAVAHRVEHRLVGPCYLFEQRVRMYQQQPGSAPVFANPRTLTQEGCRGGARVAAVRFLDAMQRPDVAVGDLIMGSRNFDELLEACLGMPLKAALQAWTQRESRWRVAEAGDQVLRLVPGHSDLHRIHGTAFLVFRSGVEPLEMEIRCGDTSDWTLAVMAP